MVSDLRNGDESECLHHRVVGVDLAHAPLRTSAHRDGARMAVRSRGGLDDVLDVGGRQCGIGLEHQRNDARDRRG